MKKATKAGEAPVTSLGWVVGVHEKVHTACKHGAGSCETCGTNNHRDKLHSTVGGKGVVAMLREKKSRR